MPYCNPRRSGIGGPRSGVLPGRPKPTPPPRGAMRHGVTKRKGGPGRPRPPRSAERKEPMVRLRLLPAAARCQPLSTPRSDFPARRSDPRGARTGARAGTPPASSGAGAGSAPSPRRERHAGSRRREALSGPLAGRWCGGAQPGASGARGSGALESPPLSSELRGRMVEVAGIEPASHWREGRRRLQPTPSHAFASRRARIRCRASAAVFAAWQRWQTQRTEPSPSQVKRLHSGISCSHSISERSGS